MTGFLSTPAYGDYNSSTIIKLENIYDETKTLDLPIVKGSIIIAPDTIKAPEGIRAYAERKTIAMWGILQWNAMDTLIRKESNYQAGRLNTSSLACGIAQALPCTKIYPDMTKSKIRQTMVWRDGKLFLANPDDKREIDWMIVYIQDRYGNPINALNWHYSHNWY